MTNMKNDPYIALRYPAFRYFICFKFFFTVALQIQSVLVGWQIYELTKDPLSLGLIGLAEVIPNISITLFGGYVADRWNRKSIVLFFALVLSGISLCLAFFSQELGVKLIYSMIALSGFCRGFIAPASFGLMSQTVPREIYVNSSTWSSSLWQVAAMIGAGCAGFLFNLVGYQPSYFLCSSLIMISFLAIAFIHYKHITVPTHDENIFLKIKEGIQFVFKDQRIVGAMSLDMFAVLFGGAVALLPIFANDILHTGASGLGLLRAAPSFGALIMAIILMRFPPLKKSGLKLYWSVALFGVFTILFAISENFYLSLLCLFLSGALDNVSVIIRTTIMQSLTPEDMKGRVSSVNSIFISSSNEIGAFESGVAAKLMGTVPSVIFGGMMTILVVLCMSKFAPKLKNMEFSREGLKD
jgi:MFS family permease